MFPVIRYFTCNLCGRGGLEKLWFHFQLKRGLIKFAKTPEIQEDKVVLGLFLMEMDFFSFV